MKAEHEAVLDRNEMSMLRWTCGFNMMDNKKNTEVRDLLGLDPSGGQVRRVDMDMLNVKMMQTLSTMYEDGV